MAYVINVEAEAGFFSSGAHAFGAITVWYCFGVDPSSRPTDSVLQYYFPHWSGPTRHLTPRNWINLTALKTWR
jgi:hypothetical protein